jgi:hypothetical protein
VQCAPTDGTATTEPPTNIAANNGNGAGKPVPTILEFKEGGVQSAFSTQTKLALAIPWRRFKKGSFLTIKLEGTDWAWPLGYVH